MSQTMQSEHENEIKRLKEAHAKVQILRACSSSSVFFLRPSAEIIQLE
jgi:hypothetical protein